MKNYPPSIFLRFFRWYCHPKLVDHIEGDLIEVYQQRLEKVTKKKADLKFIVDVLLLFRPGIIRPTGGNKNLNQVDMYKNYLTIGFRIFNREKLYSLINVSGLAMGFTCCLMIYLFVRDEISYDKFHQDSDRIYRVSAAYMRQGLWEPYSSNAWRTGELIKSNFGEVEQLVMISNDENIFVYKDKRIHESKVAWVSENFFSVFSFKLTKGSAQEALKGTNKVVISASTAIKYFGDEDPIGKVFEASDGALQLQVSGVMQDMPHNSHFHFDFLISGETLKQVMPPELFTNVGWDSQHIYIKVSPGTDPVAMEAAFPEFINKNLDFWKSTTFKLFLQPILSIHLQSNIGTELETNGKQSQVFTFSVIAIFILAIACVNYVNLTTARSLRRAKEVGMRKVMGSKRADLLRQFLTESFIMTLIAIVISLALTFLLLPEFNRFAGKEISPVVLFNLEIVVTLFFSIIVIGLFAGLYPAIVLSSFKSSYNMKGNDQVGKSGFLFRRSLVVLQFGISIGLIAALAVVFQQWEFLKNKELGINKEMLVSIPLQTMDRKQLGGFKEVLFSNHSIKKVGVSNMRMPGWISNSTEYKAQEVASDEEVKKSMKIVGTDLDFLDAIEVEFVQGRNFSQNFPDSSSIILNESAVAQLGWNEPLGRWMELNGRRFTVVGIVKDFHFETLHRKIPPIIFKLSPDYLEWAYIRIDNQNVQSTLGLIEKTYSKFVTNRDFTFTFVDQDIEKQYEAEEKFTQIFTIFTGLAIVIACLGTFGLISFAAERRSKEIGIRKVLGASVSHVSFLLIREFIFLLLIASIIALPLTWYFLNNWIETFEYRTTIGWAPFALATLLAAFIVVATTGFRAMKAALANPIDSLRDE